MLASLVAACLITLAPIPDDAAKKPKLYPLAKGTQWHSVVTIGANQAEVVTEVTESKVEKGKTTATLKSKANGMDVSEELVSDASGVSRYSFGATKLSEPLTIIKFPVKRGDSWKQQMKILEIDAEFDTLVGDVDEVTVPAGKYKATRIDSTFKLGGQEGQLTNWYVDGVGIVKQKLNIAGSDITMELKKFVPGK